MITKQFSDFTIIAIPQEYLVEYKIFQYAYILDNERYYQNYSGDNTEYTLNVSKVEPQFTGSVKWDGCSNWHFNEVYHGCSRENLLNLGNIFTVCWDWTKELCPNWNVQFNLDKTNYR